jgi:hypothetical protein
VNAARGLFQRTFAMQYWWMMSASEPTATVTTTQGAGTPCGGTTGTPCPK